MICSDQDSSQGHEDSSEQFSARMRGIAQHTNVNHVVRNLCEEFPDRLQDVIDAQVWHKKRSQKKMY